MTAVEEIHAIAEWVDHLMCEDAEYAKIDKPSLQRLAWVLMKLDNARRRDDNVVSHKFVGQIERAFASLPKPVNWRSFYEKDLKPYLKMDDEVKKVSAEKKLRKSQAKA